MTSIGQRRILLTGASGFVGRALQHRLVAAGWRVRCLTRQRPPVAASSVEWMRGDVARSGDCARAVEGCAAAVYLVHGLGQGTNLQQREVAGAMGFADAA